MTILLLHYLTIQDNADIRNFKIEEDVISSGKLLPILTSMYLHMENLSCSNIQGLKKLLYMTADDYGLNSICYIPTVACKSLLFASRYLNEALIETNLRGDDTLPPPYLC